MSEERPVAKKDYVLRELLDRFSKTTPSAPDWYMAIDMLVTEIARVELQRRESAPTDNSTKG
jgi:hypothetical protein